MLINTTYSVSETSNVSNSHTLWYSLVHHCGLCSRWRHHTLKTLANTPCWGRRGNIYLLKNKHVSLLLLLLKHTHTRTCMCYHGDSPLTTGALFTAVCTGALTHTLAALRLTLSIPTQHFPRPAGCYMFYTYVQTCTNKHKNIHKSESSTRSTSCPFYSQLREVEKSKKHKRAETIVEFHFQFQLSC